MSSRNHILEQITKNQPPATSHPGLDGNWLQYSDLRQKFADVLKGVGGTCVISHSQYEINDYLTKLDYFNNAQRVLTLCEGIGNSTIEVTCQTDPHTLDDLDFAIIPGDIAVAENAAIWIDGAKLTQRVIPFITQHLAIVVNEADLVHNLHEAYARIPPLKSQFGIFISGPSKTADIEQSLVIGAHGSRSLVVFLVK
jgi:L-lactate dehydrogenase complex protein LldG